MIRTLEPAENTVINANFIQQLERDMKNYDILYICAPFGWGKNQLMEEIHRKWSDQNVFWLVDQEEYTLEQQIRALPATGKRTFIIPKLEKILEREKDQLIWNLLNEKRKGDVFLLASYMPVPERMLPYTLLNRFISYGAEQICPTNQDVSAYMKSKGISLTEEELLLIENDMKNVPLFIQMLANLMVGNSKGYHRRLKDQCYRDVVTFIDVVFFRTFSTQDQNDLLKLSYFETFDKELISHMLGLTMRETEGFLERIYTKIGVIQATKNGWRFQPVFKFFLDRAVQKYLDFEERTADYKKALKYMVQRECWKEAIHFAYILKEKNQIAYCMSNLLSADIDYQMFLSLETYFGELNTEHLREYPKLLIAGSILKATIGELASSMKYEEQFLECLEKVKDSKVRQKLEMMMLFMYITRPGKMHEDILERSMELLQRMKYADDQEQQIQFWPHYISILRGKKDYCSYFLPGEQKNKFIEKFHQVVDSMNNRSYALMLMHMEAEVCYERNDLDRALNLLAKIIKEAKINGYDRMNMFCMVSMVDLISSKNQLSAMDLMTLEKLKINEKELPLFVRNCRAHMVYYNLLKNEKNQIEFWMKKYAPDEEQLFYTIQYYQCLIKAKVYIWREQYVRARMLLQILLEFAVEYKMAYLEAQVRILTAVIYYREANEQWKEILMPALEWARSLEFIRIFADEGAAVYELLNRLVQEDKNWAKDEWMKKVVYAAKAHMLQYPKYLKQEKQSDVEEFSESEQAVMRLLVLGGKNAEIASTLCVSENTVKYHLKNIYQKLQVKSRAQAISKIREYELL